MSGILVNLRFIYLFKQQYTDRGFYTTVFVHITFWTNCVFKTRSNSPFLNSCCFVFKKNLQCILSCRDASFIFVTLEVT